MVILGLSGHAGVGKDTVAAYLVRRYSFVSFAFSDVIYEEVQRAYGLEGQDLLRDRETKEIPTPRLAPFLCRDEEFKTLVLKRYNWQIGDAPVSPREVLQLWGTEYRRAQNPDYWLEQNEAWLESFKRLYPYPEHRPQHFVNTTCRFPNEQAWIRSRGGNVWHLRRSGVGAINDHSSDKPLPVLEGERELWNNDTIDRLFIGVDLLMSTHARYVRVDPMAKTAPANEIT